MTLLIQAAGLTHSFGGNRVFRDLAFELHDGDRVALIGENGTGKSTLFRIMARWLKPEAGTVTQKRNLVVGYLRQDSIAASNQTLREAVAGAGSDVAGLERRLRALEARMAGESGDALSETLAEYAACQERYDTLDGYAHAARVAAVLAGLGIAEERWDLPVAPMSGGERKIVGLARLLIEAPEVLLLDEPDNHLDLAGKVWLESYIAGHVGAAAVISHDRYFLDRAVNRIFELESGALHAYTGGYTAYRAEKQARLVRREQLYDQKQREVKQLKRSAEQLTEWAKMNPKFAGRAQNRRRMLQAEQEDLAATPAPILSRNRIKVSLETRRGGTKVLEIQGLGKAYAGREVFHPFDLEIAHGERIGLVGANGSGKTTLFRLILGHESPTTGNLKVGPTIKVGYYAQEHETLDPRQTPLAIVRNLKEMTEEKSLAFLRGLLFSREAAATPVQRLSGGERSRLQIATLMLSGANLLLLDEPTNNLDIASKEVLEDALLDYEGTIITISHDRYFLDRLVERTIELDNGIVRDYPGGFSYFDDHRGRGTVVTVQAPPTGKTRQR